MMVMMMLVAARCFRASFASGHFILSDTTAPHPNSHTRRTRNKLFVGPTSTWKTNKQYNAVRHTGGRNQINNFSWTRNVCSRDEHPRGMAVACGRQRTQKTYASLKILSRISQCVKYAGVDGGGARCIFTRNLYSYVCAVVIPFWGGLGGLRMN